MFSKIIFSFFFTFYDYALSINVLKMSGFYFLEELCIRLIRQLHTET